MDKHSHEIAVIESQVYTIDNVKKLIGLLLKEIKRDVVPLSDRSILSTLLCKGTTSKSVNPHQACHAASVYAVQYHLKEGYALESAKQLGCAMWNRMNNCEYFVISKKKLIFDNSDDDANMLLLEKMCRIHHKRCKYIAIQHLMYETSNKVRPYTFWMCFDDAMESLRHVKTLTQANINAALRDWNLRNKCDFFQFKKN